MQKISQLPTLCIHVDSVYYAISSTQKLGQFLSLTAFYQWARIEHEQQFVCLELNEVQMIKLSSSQMMSDDDLLLALNYENASLSNKLPESLMSSCLKANAIQEKNHDSFVCAFEKSSILNELQNASRYHLQLNAMGGLALYTMKMHFEKVENRSKSMIILLENSSFFAMTNENGAITIRNVSLGFSALENHFESWNAQMQRRLAMFGGKPISVYLADKAKSPRQKMIQLFSTSEIEFFDFSECLQTLQKLISHKSFLFPSLIVKKERIVSTYSLIIIVAIILFSAYGVMEYRQTKDSLNFAKEELQVVKQEQKNITSYQTRLSELEKKIEQLTQTFLFCGEPSHLPTSFFDVINLIANYRLLQTRILSISNENDELILVGDSVNQEDFTLFSNHIQKMLLKSNYILETEWIEKKKNNEHDILSFQFRIRKGAK